MLQRFKKKKWFQARKLKIKYCFFIKIKFHASQFPIREPNRGKHFIIHHLEQKKYKNNFNKFPFYILFNHDID